MRGQEPIIFAALVVITVYSKSVSTWTHLTVSEVERVVVKQEPVGAVMKRVIGHRNLLQLSLHVSSCLLR